jgi:hypothetical protein
LTDTLAMAHQGWRWIVLIALVVAAAEGLLCWNGKRPWTARSARILQAAAIAFDIQILLGVLTYVAEQTWSTGNPFRAYIHPFVMILALVVVHVTSARVKRSQEPRAQYRWLAVGSLLALIIATAGGALAT